MIIKKSKTCTWERGGEQEGQQDWERDLNSGHLGPCFL